MPPAPERKRTTTWAAFIRTHTDFFTAEVLTLRGLVTYYVLFFIHLESRRVAIGGITVHPNEAWLKQMARNADEYGALLGCRYLLHDRDTKFTRSFRAIVASGKVEPMALPAQSPNLNAYAERWVRSVKEECLSRVILFGERSLRRALSEYVDHFHAEQNHQRRGNVLLFPRATAWQREGPVQCRERLGGLLRYYHRQQREVASADYFDHTTSENPRAGHLHVLIRALVGGPKRWQGGVRERRVRFHLDHTIRLHTEPDDNSHHKWSIREIDAHEKPICSGQVPWIWQLWFSATSCQLEDCFKIVPAQEDSGKSEDASPAIIQYQVIRVQLRPGAPRFDEVEDYFDAVTFSMFGTERAIKKFILNIYSTMDPDGEEKCTAWGGVSYTPEVGFRFETEEDCIVFSLRVKPETFANYAEKITLGQVDQMRLCVGKVDGFYSEWSPSVYTHRVKVLTARPDEHKVILPADNEIEPPRLDRVGEAELYVDRRLAFAQRSRKTDTVDMSPQRQWIAKVANAVMPKILRLVRRGDASHR